MFPPASAAAGVLWAVAAVRQEQFNIADPEDLLRAHTGIWRSFGFRSMALMKPDISLFAGGYDAVRFWPTSAHEPCLAGMEACATAHYWARELAALGDEVRHEHIPGELRIETISESWPNDLSAAVYQLGSGAP